MGGHPGLINFSAFVNLFVNMNIYRHQFTLILGVPGV